MIWYLHTFTSTLFCQQNEIKRTVTTVGPHLAAVAERGRGGAETGIDAAGIDVETVRSGDTGAG